MARKKKAFRSKPRTGLAAAPTTNFTAFSDYIRVEVEKKEVSTIIKDFFKATLSKPELKVVADTPDWWYGSKTILASTVAWETMGKTFPDNWNPDRVKTSCIEDAKDWAERKRKEKAQAKANGPERRKKTPTEIIAERTSDFIGGIEEELDNYHNKTHEEAMKYSVFHELRLAVAPNSMAKAVVTYYTPLYEEIRELVEDKTPDLVEAYDYMSVPERRKYMEFIKQIVDDAEKYMQGKKAQRKVRIKKAPSALRQVSKIQYLKECTNYKLTSINPTQVVGTYRLYTFNVKYKRLTELVSNGKGLEISGSTIKNIDSDLSRCISLRKPDEFLQKVLKMTPTQINKEWGGLTTKTAKANGRVNKETILLRVVDK